MIKQSVKKPFTTFVAVIIVLMLAAVSLTKMTTDLLPTISTPYLVLVTTYPGASPEKVEQEITQPIENTLGTVNGVKNITSTSAENYSMVMLEFEEDTDMDSALVKVNSALDEVESSLPDLAGTPSVMEISLDMMATMYVAADRSDMDVYELTDYVNDTLSPYFQRQSGVASVSTLGLVEQMVEVRLDQDKIDTLNDRLVAKVSDQLAEAREQLDDAQSQIDSGKSQLESGQQQLEEQQSQQTQQMGELTRQMNEALATQSAYSAILTSQQANQTALQAELDAYQQAGIADSYRQMNELFAQLRAGAGAMAEALPADVADAIANPDKLELAVQMLTAAGQEETAALLTAENLQQMQDIVNTRIPQIETELANLTTEIAASQAVLDSVNSAVQGALDNYAALESGKMTAAAAFGAASAQISSNTTALTDAQTQLDEARENYNSARDQALKSANLDQLVSLDTLSSLIYAQNFSMPAGYIEDADSNQWLLKVGDELESLDQLTGMVLTNIDGIGDITLEDVASITMIDNSADSYVRMNGRDAVLLSIYKASTAGTSDVSKTCNAAIEQLEKENPNLNITVLMDQGDYIKIFINSILSNIVFGAILAVLVLAVFLRSVRPTLVVAFSIPFSVLVAVLVMYFTGITLNMMSMSGLALGIGMLVDNSIVVVENVYRLRARGIPAPRAAVQGAKQVTGAIVSSTLTTICVFLPMIFTTGMVRELMLPFALTISYALLASLVVALTVAPTMSSVLLRRAQPKQDSLLKKVQNGYGKILDFCLKRKVVPLGTAAVLLAVAVVLVARMGIVMIPAMNSDQLYVQVTMDDDLSQEECYAKADAITEKLMEVDGIDQVGAMTNMSNLMSTTMSAAGNNYQDYTYYLVLSDDMDKTDKVNAIQEKIAALLGEETGCTAEIEASSAGDMTAMMSSGLSIEISGQDLDQLMEIAGDVKEMVSSVDGFTDVSDGQEEADEVIHLAIDRDAAARVGLTAAQIYSDISSRLTTEKTSTAMTLDDQQVDVKIVDESDVLTVENLMDMTFTVNTTDEDGNAATEEHKLREFAEVEYASGMSSISRENSSHVVTVTATTEDGYNTTRLSEQVQSQLESYALPEGYTISMGGEVEQVADMLTQMIQLLALGLVLVYLVMVAQFQSLLSPFIILFTIPLAFTGGLLGLVISGDQLSMVSLLGFLVLMGTVVNNGIVFVDYTNQLRLGGMGKREALIATGKTRLRPILMTALTTILAMGTMMFSQDITANMSRGMAVVVAGGLAYATLMTLFVVPVMYDLLYRRQPKQVDVGEDLDDAPDDAAEFLANR